MLALSLVFPAGHQRQLELPCGKQPTVCFVCRGIKRSAPMGPYATSPPPPPAPYKLVPVGLAAPRLPAVVHSTVTAGLGSPHAKRRRGGGGSPGPAVPWSMLTPGYAHNHRQRSITARSLFHPAMGGVALQGQVLSRQCAKRMSLDERQKEQRVVLQCVLQHQTAAMQSFKPAVLVEGTQVAFSFACMQHAGNALSVFHLQYTCSTIVECSLVV